MTKSSTTSKKKKTASSSSSATPPRTPLIDNNGRPILDGSGNPIYDEIVAEEDLDLSAEIEFLQKNDYMDGKVVDDGKRKYACLSAMDGDVAPISSFYEFVAEIFERYGQFPFEDKLAHNYEVWRKQEDEGIENKDKDYSECDGRRLFNGICYWRKPRKNPKVRKEKVANGEEVESKEYDTCERKMLLKDDWETMDWLDTRYFVLTSPLTYIGRTASKENARMLFAFGIDMDDVGVAQLDELFNRFEMRFGKGMQKKHPKLVGEKVVPKPNLIVNSGHGLHLYYILEHPVPIGRWKSQNTSMLQRISDYLYDVVFEPQSKNHPDEEPGTTKRQKPFTHLGIYHQFRTPGTLTKPLRVNKKEDRVTGKGLPIRAWKLMDVPHYSISSLVGPYVWIDDFKDFTPDVIKQLESGDKILDPNHLTLDKAMEMWPDWAPDSEFKGYTCNRALYDWWLSLLQKPFNCPVKEGHRHYCIRVLAVLARKCNIPYEELYEDAFGLQDKFDKIGQKPGNRFTAYDIKMALRFYNSKKAMRYSHVKLMSWAGIEMKRKIRRNKERQDIHLDIIRSSRDIKRKKRNLPEWNRTGNNGRKKGFMMTEDNSCVAQKIALWRFDNPESKNKSACSRDCGFTRKTVLKWWETRLDANVKAVSEWVKENPGKNNYKACAKSCGIVWYDVKRWWNIFYPDTAVSEVEPIEVPSEKPVVILAKLFAPGSEYTIEGFTHEELLEAVTSGKWQELGLDLGY